MMCFDKIADILSFVTHKSRMKFF